MNYSPLQETENYSPDHKRNRKNFQDKLENQTIRTGEIHKILVPVDYSANSIRALKDSLRFAERLNSEVLVLHVFHAPFTDEHMPAEMVNDMLAAQKQKCESEIDEFCKKYCSVFEHTIKISHKLLMGFAAEAIRDLALTENCDIVVMGTKGANSFQDKLFGTVTWNIIKNSNIPVIAIPENAKFDDIKNIMFPFEGTDRDFETIEYLLSVAEKFNAEVHAVHFMIDNNANKSFTDKLHSKFRKKIEAEKLQLYFLSEKNITEGIRRFAQKHNMDMICMITHNHGFLSTVFHMSITRNIVLYSEIPLLAYNVDRV